MRYLLNYPGAHGDAKGRYVGWIELLGVSLPAGQKTTGGDYNTVLVKDVSVTKFTDTSSAFFMKESYDGGYHTVEIVYLDKFGLEKMKVSMRGARISSFSVSGQGRQDNKTLDTLTFSYDELHVSLGGGPYR